MTEAEWLAATDPTPMLEFLRGKASDRKLRLFAVACCRRIWGLCPEATSRTSIEVAELFADGMADDGKLYDAHADASRYAEGVFEAVYPPDWPEDMGYWLFEVGGDAAAAANAAACASSSHPIGSSASDYIALGLTPQPAGTCSTHSYASQALAHSVSPLRVESVNWHDTPERRAVKAGEARAQAALVGDIFGNPFRPVTPDPSWLTPTVLALAGGIYADRAFDRLPILADALQDAGCDNADVLDHCRGPGPHVRGCWVVDLVLGKG
jgi:hypothetical protein